MANDQWNQGGPRNTGGGATGLAEKAKDAAGGIAGTARDWAADAADRAKDVASTAADTARDWASNVAHRAEGAYAATRDSVVGAEHSVESFIRRHPVQSVFIALGVGCLLGCALARR